MPYKNIEDQRAWRKRYYAENKAYFRKKSKEWKEKNRERCLELGRKNGKKYRDARRKPKVIPDYSDGKLCPGCNVKKPLDNYHRVNRNGKQTYYHLCKECKREKWKEYALKGGYYEKRRLYFLNRKNSGEEAEYAKKYYHKNKERIKEKTKRWADNNRERLRERQRDYKKKNIEKFRKWEKAYREKNKKKISEYRKKHRKKEDIINTDWYLTRYFRQGTDLKIQDIPEDIKKAYKIYLQLLREQKKWKQQQKT